MVTLRISGHVCRGNVSSLVWWSIIKFAEACAVIGLAEYHKKNYITGSHVCGGNVSLLVWRSSIKNFTSPAVMFAEAMCSFWSGRVS